MVFHNDTLRITKAPPMVFHNDTLRITKAPPPSPSLKSKVVGMVMMAFLFIVRFLFVFTFYNIYDVIAEI